VTATVERLVVGSSPINPRKSGADRACSARLIRSSSLPSRLWPPPPPGA